MVETREMQNIYREAKAKGLNYVNDYWKEGSENEIWREWKDPKEWGNNISDDLKARLVKEVDSRRIKKITGLDILRWGGSTKGTFTVKEAYYIKSKQAQEEQGQEWKQLWRNRWWAKITMFAWLVGRRRILTWDHINKRGFQGPPRCSLCKQNIETQEHILNSCPIAQQQWEETNSLFGKTNRNPQDITLIIFQWGKGQFQIPIVCKAWSLVMGFNISTI